MEQADGHHTSRVTITREGLAELLSDEPSKLSSMEARCLAMLLSKPLSALELVLAVRNSSREYKFLDPKYVSVAVGELTDRGFAQFENLQAKVEQPKRSKRKGRQ